MRRRKIINIFLLVSIVLLILAAIRFDLFGRLIGYAERYNSQKQITEDDSEYPDYIYETFEMECEKIRAYAGQRDVAICKLQRSEDRKLAMIYYPYKALKIISTIGLYFIAYVVAPLVGGAIGGMKSMEEK